MWYPCGPSSLLVHNNAGEGSVKHSSLVRLYLDPFVQAAMKPTAFRMANWSLSHRDASRFGPSSRWSNKDMDPVLPEDRTWTTWDYIAYWVSDATNAAVWQLASSMLAVGLSWRQALPAIAVGNIIIAVSSPNIIPNFGPVQTLLLAG